MSKGFGLRITLTRVSNPYSPGLSALRSGRISPALKTKEEKFLSLADRRAAPAAGRGLSGKMREPESLVGGWEMAQGAICLPTGTGGP